MQVLTERRPAVHIGLGKELVHGAADGRDEERLARHQEAVDTILASWLEAAAAENIVRRTILGVFEIRKVAIHPNRFGIQRNQ